MKILVTGGAGFIGSNFIHRLLSKYPEIEILNYDKLTYSGNLENLVAVENDRRYKFIRGDIADDKKLLRIFKEFKPDHVINFAAETHVDRSIHSEREEFFKTNINGVFNLLEIIRQQPVKSFVQVSTDEVYGSLPLDSSEKFSENSPLAPNNPYAAMKAGADLLCRTYYSTFNLPVIVTRGSNNFGSYQYPEKLIPFFTLRMLEDKKLPIYGDGKNIRDWIYVLDHCAALESCLFNGKSGEIYNISANNEMSNLEITDLILKYFKRNDSWIKFVADRPAHDKRYALDASKIKKELNWQPIHSFKESFEKTIEWYLNNRQWIANIRKKEKGADINPHIK